MAALLPELTNVPQHAMLYQTSIQRRTIIRGDPLLELCAEEAQPRMILETIPYLPWPKLDAFILVTGHFEFE